jgi:translation initiation factor 2 alpha subunit (eIF-2alpha)
MNMMGLGNKEIAKMAAEQTAIRQRLEQLKNELNKDGKGKGNQLNPLLKELEQQEKDLINKNFSSEMINRQKDIMTRLLESEKAMMERGFEEKRESKSGVDQIKGNLIEIKTYNRDKLKQVEMLQVVDPSFSIYYKSKAETYFNLVD